MVPGLSADLAGIGITVINTFSSLISSWPKSSSVTFQCNLLTSN